MAWEDRIMRMAAQQGREQAIKRRDAVNRGINPRGDRVDIRFGPSEKQFTKRHYTPSGLGTTWGTTGETRRKSPGYDLGARPPRGLASLISRRGRIGRDPRSSTYANDWDFAFGSPDDLLGYRASVANVAAANAAKEQQRIAEETAGEFLPEPTIPYQYRGRYETPGEIGKGYGMMGEEPLGLPNASTGTEESTPFNTLLPWENRLYGWQEGGAGGNPDDYLETARAPDEGIMQMATPLNRGAALNILQGLADKSPEYFHKTLPMIYGDDLWDQTPSFNYGGNWFGNPDLSWG